MKDVHPDPHPPLTPCHFLESERYYRVTGVMTASTPATQLGSKQQ